MALGQVDLAVDLLQGRNGHLDEHAVHETRKALKRLRALVRLLSTELGQGRFARENAALRDLARRLSGARDSEVMLATLDALLKRHPRKLQRRRGVRALRHHLAAEHAEMERRSLGDATMRADAVAELLALRGRVLGWDLRSGQGITLVEPGLRRIYQQGRNRYRRAAKAKRNRRTRAMHEWRKRVKDLRYAAEMLQRRTPSSSSASGKATNKRAARLRRLGRRADELGELLGEDHDLAVLAALVESTSKGPGGARPPRLRKRDRKLLLKLIGRRRRRLQEQALRAGGRLYEDRPRRFLSRVRASYRPT
jgi:CHAD domain-containing protein